jgi:hypothetical protein
MGFWKLAWGKVAKTKRTVEAITPTDIRQLKADGIPEEIITAFNSLIVKNWDGNKAVIRQEEVAERAKGLFYMAKGIDVQDIYDRHWLEVELIYEAKGWNVRYVKHMLSVETLADIVFTRK